jgi:hypothetical protein
MLPMPRRSRSRSRNACPRCERTGGRVPRGRAKSGAPRRRSMARSRAAEDLGELILLRRMVAWHTGDWETACGLAVEADRIAPDPGDLADLRGMSAYLDGGWEQHSRHQPMHVWDSPELASRVFDAYQCATEYVLTAGDRYDRVAGFAKRLRGAGAPGRCSPRGSVRRHRAGRDGAVHGQPRGRAGTSSTQRGSARWVQSEATRQRPCASARRCFTWATGPARGRSWRGARTRARVAPRRASAVPRLRRVAGDTGLGRRGARLD